MVLCSKCEPRCFDEVDVEDRDIHALTTMKWETVDWYHVMLCDINLDDGRQ